MQTCEAIASPTFTGLWRDANNRWHIKHNGIHKGTFRDLAVASANLGRYIHMEQQVRMKARLAHAAELNALRLEGK